MRNLQRILIAGFLRAKTPHYVLTKEPIFVQVHTTGPLLTNPIKQ